MNKKKKKKIIIISILILFLILIVLLSMLISKMLNKNKVTEEEVVVELNDQVSEIQTNKLANMQERDRINKYAADFFTILENKDYEEAYSLLNKEFKENFFPTQESFDNYVKKRFYKNISLEYENIERAGDVYVLWINMSNLLGDNTKIDKINLVIKENDLNDYELSFSVNKK